MREHLKNRARLLSYVSAGLVGFGFGIGSLIIGGGAFILAIVFDLISGTLSGKIEQNKKDVQTCKQTERELWSSPLPCVRFWDRRWCQVPRRCGALSCGAVQPVAALRCFWRSPFNCPYKPFPAPLRRV